MKIKHYLNIFLISLGLILVLNITLIKYYNAYITDTLNSVTNALVEAYPESEDKIIDIILDGPKDSKVLKKYGLDSKTISSVSNYHSLTIKLLILTNLIYFSILFIFLFHNIMMSKKIKKEIGLINSYLTKILKGTYDINIADYNEDELSILKNDIYKVTIKLKEYSNFEHQEKVYLMTTLEDISHQLKTPLTALMITNDILKSNNLTKEEYIEFLNKETKELERMEWLITTLLKISKLDSGSIKLKKENIKISNIIASSLEALGIAIELKNINIVTNNLDFNLICDFNWTKEALINILKNAIEHLGDGGTITISGDDNPLYFGITITDNGPGIKREDIKNIFKRFYSTNTTKNSIGIGLNMAKLIIEHQNGKIEVKSRLGEYTTFKIIFSKNDY